MSKSWDGRPERPERDGWHWLHHPEDLRPVVQPWSAEHGAWISGAMHSPRGVVDLGFCYLGPALLPAEVAAREAAAAEAMREACEARIRTYPIDCEMRPYTAMEVVNRDIALADEIAALPRLAADVLARALDQARAEEREYIAQIFEANDMRSTADEIRARGKEVGGE